MGDTIEKILGDVGWILGGYGGILGDMGWILGILGFRVVSLKTPGLLL